MKIGNCSIFRSIQLENAQQKINKTRFLAVKIKLFLVFREFSKIKLFQFVVCSKDVQVSALDAVNLSKLDLKTHFLLRIQKIDSFMGVNLLLQISPTGVLEAVKHEPNDVDHAKVTKKVSLSHDCPFCFEGITLNITLHQPQEGFGDFEEKVTEQLVECLIKEEVINDESEQEEAFDVKEDLYFEEEDEVMPSPATAKDEKEEFKVEPAVVEPVSSVFVATVLGVRCFNTF